MPTSWNPSDADITIGFSNNNLTAILPASSRTVRATTAKATGKWYFEGYNTWFGGSRMIGVALKTATLGNYLGGDANGFGIYYSSGWRTAFSGGFTNEGGIVSGNCLGVCVDLDNDFIYAVNNGVNVVGDPTTLTGGKAIPAGTLYAATGGSNGRMTVNFGANNFAFAPPAPFIAWDASQFNYEPFDAPLVSIGVVSYGVGT